MRGGVCAVPPSRALQQGLNGEEDGGTQHEPGNEAPEGRRGGGEEEERSRDAPEGGHGAERDQPVPLAGDLVAEARRAAHIAGPDAHRVGDVRRQSRIAQGQEQREGDEAAPAGHAVDDTGTQSTEEEKDDVGGGQRCRSHYRHERPAYGALPVQAGLSRSRGTGGGSVGTSDGSGRASSAAAPAGARGERQSSEHPARRRYLGQKVGAALLHRAGQVLPLAPVQARDLFGQLAQQAGHLPPVLLGHTAHHEHGGCRQIDVRRRQIGQAGHCHLGILQQTELVLERRQLPGEAVRAPAVELGTELE